jgi:hypothetical protein
MHDKPNSASSSRDTTGERVLGKATPSPASPSASYSIDAPLNFLQRVTQRPALQVATEKTTQKKQL